MERLLAAHLKEAVNGSFLIWRIRPRDPLQTANPSALRWFVSDNRCRCYLRPTQRPTALARSDISSGGIQKSFAIPFRMGGHVAETIEKFIAERGIKSLFHFTRLDNLASILESGLLTKDACQQGGIVPTINDPLRYDGTGAVCATISFPNYKMFYRLRCDNPDVEWVVLKLKRSLLWRKHCAFCSTNAGDGSVYTIPIEQRQGLAPLQAMFGDYGIIKREDLAIPDHYPTNPQAEVLLLDGASVDDITGVYFQRSVTQRQYAGTHDWVPCHLNGGFFNGRSDWKSWK